MKKLLMSLVMFCILLCGCSQHKTIITNQLQEEKSDLVDQEQTKNENNQIHIYQNTYRTYVSNNSNGDLSIFNPGDDNKIQIYQYDSAAKEYVFENIDYRYNFHESYAKLSSEQYKIVDGSMSPNGLFVIIEQKQENQVTYSVYNTSTGEQKELVNVAERYKNGQSVYQLQFAWSDDGKMITYGIQLRSLNLPYPSYYGNTEEFSCVYVRNMELDQVVYKFHRTNLKNDCVLYNYKLGINQDGSKVIIYNNTYLGKAGCNKISVIDTSKKTADFATNYSNTDVYNSSVIYEDEKLYRINEDHTLSMLNTRDLEPEWERILYRESNIIAYVPFQDGKRFIVVEDAKTETMMESNDSTEYNIYLCSRVENTRKLLYKTSNPFLSMKLNGKEDTLLLESMMPYYNNESYVEADLITTVISY